MTTKNITSRSLIATVGLVLLAISLLSVTVALADTLVYDGDIITAGTQTTVNLGTRTPGEEISQTIEVKLICDSKKHADRGTTVTVEKGPASSVPADGALSMGSVVFTIPNDWPEDATGSGTNCASTPETLTATTPVTITAPSSPGSYIYELALERSVSSGALGDVKQPSPPKLIFTLSIPAPSDTTPPTINCTVPSQTVWYGTDVTVPCTASDASGLANPSDASFSLSTTVLAGTETTSAATNTRQVCDTLGNCATAGPYTFKVDKKAPVINCTVPSQTVWYGTDVTVPCTASDGGSGLANPADASFDLTTSVAANTETNSATTGSKTVEDGVGNSATAGPYTFKVDKKAPVVSCGSADSDWHATDQSVTCTATDGGSGPASQTATLSTNVAAGTETDSAYTDTHTFSDDVGNSATAGPVGPFKIDKKAPVININVPTATTYTLNQAVAASYICTDGGSGVSSCTGPVPNGSNIDTNSVGSKTFTVNATDNAGNSGTLTHNYSVIYTWTGFFRPVDNLPTLNVAKAGSAIPVKFSLSGDQGLSIFAEGYPSSTSITCGSTVLLDVIEETVTAGGSSLNYDASADQYIYVWKTSKTWAGMCRQLIVKLVDNEVYRANFSFKK